MNTTRRNVLVGVCVTGSLIVLGWLIFQVGGNLASPFSPKQFAVTFTAERADGLSPGSPIKYKGISVGRVENVRYSENGNSVEIQAKVDVDAPVPANVLGRIDLVSYIGGTSMINLEITDPTPKGELQPDAELVALYTGTSLIPPQAVTLLDELSVAAHQFNEMKVMENFNARLTEAGTMITATKRTVDNVDALVGDPKVQEDIKLTLAGARDTTQKVTELVAAMQETLADIRKQTNGFVDNTNTRLEGLSNSMDARLTQLAKLMDESQALLTDINAGKGNVGLLLKDEKLYVGLVESVRLLNVTIEDAQRVVRQLEQEGIIRVF